MRTVTCICPSQHDRMSSFFICNDNCEVYQQRKRKLEKRMTEPAVPVPPEYLDTERTDVDEVYRPVAEQDTQPIDEYAVGVSADITPKAEHDTSLMDEDNTSTTVIIDPENENAMDTNEWLKQKTPDCTAGDLRTAEESLGGNSQTRMLATVSPSSAHVDETLSTLRYACQARSIVNYAHVNECPHERIIRELRAEVEELKSVQQAVGYRQMLAPPRRLLPEEDPRDKELQQLRQELRVCKAALREAQNDQRSTGDIAVKQETFDGQDEQLCQLPFLVRIAADSVHFAAAHHFLQEGITVIGQLGSDPIPHMALEGSTIQPNHCTIENKDGRLILMSSSGADLLVNNKRPKENQELQDGDWLAIGGIHHFRVFKKENFCGRHVQNNGSQHSSDTGYSLESQNERIHEELELWKGLAQETRRNAENNEANFKQEIEQLTLTAQSYKKSLEKEQAKLKELEQKMLQLENLYQKQRQHCQKILSHPCEHEIVSSYKSSMLEELEHILNETPKEFEEVAVKIEEPSEEDISEQYEQMSYYDDEEMTEFKKSWNQHDAQGLQDISLENGDSLNKMEQQGNSSAETRSEAFVDFAQEVKELLGNTEEILNKILHSAESNERLRTVNVLSAVVEQLTEVLDSVLLPAKSNLRTLHSQKVSKVVRFHLSESQLKSS